jgi:hypothetical protein
MGGAGLLQRAVLGNDSSARDRVAAWCPVFQPCFTRSMTAEPGGRQPRSPCMKTGSCSALLSIFVCFVCDYFNVVGRHCVPGVSCVGSGADWRSR